ncbi:MAG TPA: hypothetical protein VN673_00235 [Clostridia bacterium]|nr:hypothetical protein [Clostridia bacterium]
MKTNSLLIPGLALALGITIGASPALAHPYATCLTNNAGQISFRLNESADTVRVLWNNGASSTNLGALSRGLTVTNIGVVTSPFQVEVTKGGSGTPSLISDNANTFNQFEYPRGVTVNTRPASPYFGRIYVANGRVGTTTTGRPVGQGVYVLNADSTDALGQGNTALTGGINMTSGGNVMPWRIKVGVDNDNVYLCDWSDVSGALWETDPNVGSGVNVLGALTGPLSSPLPAGYNHGSVSEVVVTGSLTDGNLTVFSVDEDYETNPGFQSELNSLWRYNIGSGPLPWINLPDQLVAVAPISANFSQTMGLDRATNGYLYLTDSRSAGAENGLLVIDPTGPIQLFDSLSASMNLGFSRDVLSNTVSVAVSRDMKFCATLRGGGTVVVMPMIDGIPDLASRIEFVAIGSSARAIAFDAANNLYVVSNATERMRVYSLGLTTTCTTGSEGTFGLSSPSTTVSVLASTDTVTEAGEPAPPVFTITRSNNDLTQPQPVQFATTGTATRGTDYVLQTNGVTVTGNTVVIPAGTGDLMVTLVPSNDSTAELTETAILELQGGVGYSAVAPASATVSITDNESPTIDITAVQASMFEAVSNDYVRFRLTRRGDLNAASFSVDVTYTGGTAASTRFTGPTTAAAFFDVGDVSKNFDVNPVNDALLQGNQTIIARVAAGTGYNVGTNSVSATATIVDDEVLPETVLYSENFNTDVSANWTTRAGSINGVDDYRTVFGYDYGSGIPPLGALTFPVLPTAPHGSDTLGLYMTANKDESSPLGAAGVNVYPNGKTFSGDFAVRFDMYLMVGAAASTTEYALFGINHSGNATNWFRNSAGGITNGTFDGIFFGVECDAAALGDYVVYSQPVPGAFNPVALTPGVNASTLTGIFKAPPYAFAGAPANNEASTTPSWAQVEISKIGSYIKLKINNTQIMTYSNATSFTAGNIMLGYCDAFDSVMAGNSGVIYDNLRVISLGPPQVVPATTVLSGTGNTNVTVGFSFPLDEPASAFRLQSAPTVQGPYADVTATITKQVPGVYSATTTRSAGATAGFYRARYAP